MYLYVIYSIYILCSFEDEYERVHGERWWLASLGGEVGWSFQVSDKKIHMEVEDRYLGNCLTTSAEVTPNGGLVVRESPQMPLSQV